MKNLKTLLTSVADAYCVSPDEVTDSIRAYLEYLLNDPEFRKAWEEIPKTEGVDEVEVLLGLMICEISTDISA